jgi:hypothetical protein
MSAQFQDHKQATLPGDLLSSLSPKSCNIDALGKKINEKKREKVQGNSTQSKFKKEDLHKGWWNRKLRIPKRKGQHKCNPAANKQARRGRKQASWVCSPSLVGALNHKSS